MILLLFLFCVWGGLSGLVSRWGLVGLPPPPPPPSYRIRRAILCQNHKKKTMLSTRVWHSTKTKRHIKVRFAISVSSQWKPILASTKPTVYNQIEGVYNRFGPSPRTLSFPQTTIMERRVFLSSLLVFFVVGAQGGGGFGGGGGGGFRGRPPPGFGPPGLGPGGPRPGFLGPPPGFGPGRRCL